MTDEIEKKLLAGPAYRIFHAEVLSHFEILEAAGSEKNLSASKCSELSQRCHTIRGGAGFLKLTDLAKIAGELEKSLQSKNPLEAGQILQEKLPTLKVLIKALPKPAEG